jgi:excisionase family DNA binding protein
MQNKTLSPEKYPLVIQVIESYLTIFAPDFDYRVAEPYRPHDIGQTEMMIMKVRREIASKLNLISKDNTPLPSPTKGKQVFAVMDGDTLSTREVARLMRVSEETVRRLAARGALKLHTTPGGHRRFLRSSVHEYVEKNRSDL